jgi:hypothetical protein
MFELLGPPKILSSSSLTAQSGTPICEANHEPSFAYHIDPRSNLLSAYLALDAKL